MKNINQVTTISCKSGAVFESRGFANESHAILVTRIKDQAAILLDLMGDISIPPDNAAEVGRLVALAKTDLESCVMWAVKAVSRFEKSRNE